MLCTLWTSSHLTLPSPKQEEVGAVVPSLMERLSIRITQGHTASMWKNQDSDSHLTSGTVTNNKNGKQYVVAWCVIIILSALQI